MLTEEQIKANKDRFLKLLSEIDLESADTEGLAKFLLESDFFTAPASTKYHCAFKGGLCQHSLNVYDTLCKLVEDYAWRLEVNPQWVPELGEEQEDPHYIKKVNYDDYTLKMVALFHDISKANFYEVYYKNVNKGKDGRDNWVKEANYKVREAKDRFLAADHATNSLLILQQYLPLSLEESTAIINHHGFTVTDPNRNTEVSNIFDRYPLVVLLSMADQISTYVLESKYHEQDIEGTVE